MSDLALATCLAAMLSVCAGCSKMMVDTELQLTRRASGAFDGVGDYEVARSAAISVQTREPARRSPAGV